MNTLIRQFRQWLARENGTASVEFVLVMPLAVAVFFAAAESSIVSLRKTFLDSAIEQTVRELRLGTIKSPTWAELQTKICARMRMVDDCENNLLLQFNIVSISGTTLTLPNTSGICTNSPPPEPPNVGAANQLVLVKACLLQTIVFPTTNATLPVVTAINGKVHLVSTTVFVNEPRT